MQNIFFLSVKLIILGLFVSILSFFMNLLVSYCLSHQISLSSKILIRLSLYVNYFLLKCSLLDEKIKENVKNL